VLVYVRVMKPVAAAVVVLRVVLQNNSTAAAVTVVVKRTVRNRFVIVKVKVMRAGVRRC
jgi:hypothetical protein